MSGPSIRIGTVSTVDYKNGMVSVQYPELDGSVTNKMPVLSFNGEYKMPEVDDMVLVVYLSNGSSIGIVLGTFWNQSNKPASTGKGIYRKQIASGVYVEYKDDELTVHAPKIKLETNTGTTEY
jgi:phage baseplate assembly protein gpV